MWSIHMHFFYLDMADSTIYEPSRRESIGLQQLHTPQEQPTSRYPCDHQSKPTKKIQHYVINQKHMKSELCTICPFYTNS